MQSYSGAGNAQAEQLKQFWQGQLVEVSEVPSDPAVFKNHQLPLARIKKIMKSDEDVRMISAEAPVLFAKACEMFILELTLRSWMHAEENKRRTLQRNDVAAAITKTDIFDFLVDIVPREDLKEDGTPAAGAPAAAPPPAAAPSAPAAQPAAAPAAAAPRPSTVPAPVPGHPALAGGPPLYFPYPLPGDPAAAAAAAAAMMRPPLPMGPIDPALMTLYSQQLMAGQPPWPPIAGLPPPPLGAPAGPQPSASTASGQPSTGQVPSAQQGGEEADN